MRNELLGTGSARDIHRASSEQLSFIRSCCVRVRAVVIDLLTILLLCTLGPMLFAVMGFFCLVPILERLLHPRREYMDGVSAAYLNHVEEAVIHALVTTRDRVDAEAVFRAFEQTYVSSPRQEFARFRQRAVRRKWLWPYFTCEHVVVDPSHHFRAVTDHLTQRDMEKKIAEVEGQLMDFDRPLWELWHFQDYTDENGRPCSLIMLRVHHAVMDGFTGLRVMMQGADPNKPSNSAPGNRADRRRRLGCVEMVRFWLRAVRKLLLMPTDSPSVYKSSRLLKPSSARTVAWSSLNCTSVADLKVLGQKLEGATINDILMAALTGALKKYAHRTEGAMLPSDVNACTWVSLSPLKHIYSDFRDVPLIWGNSTLGAVYIKLPIGPVHRDVSVGETLQALRKSTADPALMLEAGTATAMISMFGWLPRLVARPVWPLLTNKVSLSMSNVPGPQFALSWLGVPVRHMLFFVPPAGSISLFVTIVTWNGSINVGMGIDSELFSQEDLKQICGEFIQGEIEELKKEALRAEGIV